MYSLPMKVVRGRAALASLPGRPRGAAFAVGNFDGVHRGHQALLRVARAQATAHGGEVAVLTFDPHPARLFAPALAPPLIVSLARRLELLGAAGADWVVVEPFTPEFAAIEATAFVRQVLAGDLGARDVVVGYDFSFGRSRGGDARLLTSEGAALGLGVEIVPPVLVGGLTCSSTKVREFVLEGRVEGAAMVLGRPFELTGEVVRGAGRGRGLGMPTANLNLESELLPRAGIYAGRAVILEDADQARTGGAGATAAGVHLCAISVGTNPTFTDAGAVTVEAHLLDFDADLYGRRLRLELLHRLRDERRFESSAALMSQIEDDLARTRKMVVI
jgi:riboflavin kinase/FMN adenylyltransferase